jgi:hypothetical protein
MQRLVVLRLPLPKPEQREHLIQRRRRFVQNERVPPADCYRVLAHHLLAVWPQREVNLVMDRTDLEDRRRILTLGVAYRKRILPLTWDVFDLGASDSVRQIGLLQRLRPDLPAAAGRVHLYADCESRSVALQRVCQRYGWPWQAGLKGEVAFHPGDRHWQRSTALQLQRGERRYLHGVYLNQNHPFDPVDVIADWAAPPDRPRYWSLDQTTDAQAWRRGRPAERRRDELQPRAVQRGRKR